MFRILTLSLTLVVLVGQFGFAYSSGHWEHLRSTHFTVSYDQGAEPFAGEALSVAEETWSTLTLYFGDRPEARHISIVLSDGTDIPNGGAVVADPVVYIDCRKSASLFRGETHWIRTVVTHELSHQYSLNYLKAPVWLNLLLAQSSTVSNVDTEVFTNTSPVSLPVWFVEGLAQMGSRKARADEHDVIRQMILRDAWATGHLLNLEEMARFEGTSRDYELAYNQGFSFLVFLQDLGAEDSLSKLCVAVRRVGFAQAFPSVFRKPLHHLYQDWVDSLKSKWGDPVSSADPNLFLRQGPMVMETSSFDEQRWVIANWDNDYTRFGLFERNARGYSTVARDTGLIVRGNDSKVWFTKDTFDVGRGNNTSELWSAQNGGIRQVTNGARVMAFDANEDRVVYARYRGRQTEIVELAETGTERTLTEAPQGSEVYRLSLGQDDRFGATLGLGDRVVSAVYDGHQWQILWPQEETLDLQWVDADRVIFSSTHTGSPQIYWANITTSPLVWHQLTNAFAGARFPVAERGQVSYSEYQDGGWHLKKREGGLSDANPVEVAGPEWADPTRVDLPDQDASMTTSTNVVLHGEPVTLGFVGQNYNDVNGTSVESLTAVGAWGGSVYSAPRDWALSFFVEVDEPLMTGQPAEALWTFQVKQEFALATTQNAVGLQSQAASVYFNQYGYQFLHYLFRDFYWHTQWQPGQNQSLGLALDTYSSTDTTSSPEVTYFRRDRGGVRWVWSESPVSVFDPAELGQSGFQLWAGWDLMHPWATNRAYYSTATSTLLDPGLVQTANAGVFTRLLLADSKISVSGNVRALGFWGAVSGPNVALSTLPSVGGATWFSGYPAGYALVNSMVTGVLALRTNPLVNTIRHTAWWDRLSLGTQVEVGLGQVFMTKKSPGLVTVMPLSVEVSLRWGWYAVPDRQSDLEVHAAMALSDFVANNGGSSLGLPFQVYATLSL